MGRADDAEGGAPSPRRRGAPALQWVRTRAPSGTTSAPWAPSARCRPRRRRRGRTASATGSSAAMAMSTPQPRGSPRSVRVALMVTADSSRSRRTAAVRRRATAGWRCTRTAQGCGPRRPQLARQESLVDQLDVGASAGQASVSPPTHSMVGGMGSSAASAAGVTGSFTPSLRGCCRYRPGVMLVVDDEAGPLRGGGHGPAAGRLRRGHGLRRQRGHRQALGERLRPGLPRPDHARPRRSGGLPLGQGADGPGARPGCSC